MPTFRDRLRRRRVDDSVTVPNNDIIATDRFDALMATVMANSFRSTEAGGLTPAVQGPKGSAMNPFLPAEMREMIDELAESESLPKDIHENLVDAFTRETEVNYRLHVTPEDDTCDLYVNEVFIIQLKGLGRDPFEVGKGFLNIINRKLFDVDLVDSSNIPDDDYGDDI